MKLFAIFLVALGLLALLFGCGPGPPKAKLDAEDQFLLAKQKFDDRKYFDAQTKFQKLIWNFPGSDYVDEAQYYLAECFFGQEDYQSAIHEYTRLLRNYSQSPFVDAAQFKIGVSYYKQSLPAPLDQDDTQKAARTLQTFLEDYPNSEYVPEAEKYLLAARTRLSKKEYLNGQLYYKMGAYDSAIIYFEELLENYSDTKWADDAQYAIGECQRRQKKWERALQSYQKVLEMSNSKKLAQRAQKRIDKIEKELTETPKSSE
jgi:outer membrane protein assembly factor BamD